MQEYYVQLACDAVCALVPPSILTLIIFGYASPKLIYSQQYVQLSKIFSCRKCIALTIFEAYPRSRPVVLVLVLHPTHTSLLIPGATTAAYFTGMVLNEGPIDYIYKAQICFVYSTLDLN